MSNALLLLLSTYCAVFCLGLQSQLVNNGHAMSAFVNSLAIGSAQLILYKLAPNAGTLEIAAFLLGGPFGIVSSMYFYRWRYKSRAEYFYDGIGRKPVKK